MADKDQRFNADIGNMKEPHADLSHTRERFFEIRTKGQLDRYWSEWLDGLEVKLLKNGEMILYGPIVDQAALMGILNKLNNLNLTLLSLNEVKKKD